jgi:hypothetical protein
MATLFEAAFNPSDRRSADAIAGVAGCDVLVSSINDRIDAT